MHARDIGQAGDLAGQGTNLSGVQADVPQDARVEALELPDRVVKARAPPL
jgi:hypothetical protein